MKEKHKKEKHPKTHKKDKKREKSRRKYSSSSSSSSSQDEWVEKEPQQKQITERDEWMSMTGMLKTYTKDDKPKKEDKKHIDSYNPSTSSRELNPYWKNGGSGLPQTAESFRSSVKFLKPPDDDDDDNYYRKSRSSSSTSRDNRSREDHRPSHEEHYRKPSSSSRDFNDYRKHRSNNWKISEENKYEKKQADSRNDYDSESKSEHVPATSKQTPDENNKYLSDEKMNKLAAKIVKAEIMGDNKLVEQLKAKLEAAREYRKQNPDAEQPEDEGIMLITTNSSGNSRPLANASKGDARSKGGKRKAETHMSGERAKYFGNDDKYNLAQMFQNEKYGNNYNEDAELARIASKSKNPNDDMEDIFMDEISKNRNEAKDSEAEKKRAINQHVKLERSLEGCEYCVESKNMLKHLMVSCGNKVYLALPSRRSLVKGHCLISTIQHTTCVTALDEDVWEEVMNYRKALTQFYNSQDQDVIFYETATRLHKFPHMVINCVPLPRDVGDMAAIYFKKALLECEAEWSMNKKVVDLKGKNIRKGVPKGLPYFWIDFGMDPGFAHVIEDQRLFPNTFAEEIVAGILDLEHNVWKNPKREYGDVQRKKVADFLKEWKPFDIIDNK